MRRLFVDITLFHFLHCCDSCFYLFLFIDVWTIVDTCIRSVVFFLQMKRRHSVDQCSGCLQITKKIDIIKQMLPMCEGNMGICSPSTGSIALGQ